MVNVVSLLRSRQGRKRGEGFGAVRERGTGGWGGKGKEGCGVRVRGDLRASLYVYHTAARPLRETTKKTKVRCCLWDRSFVSI